MSSKNVLETSSKIFSRTNFRGPRGQWQACHGTSLNVVDVVYRTKSGKEIKENKTIKDLGVLTSENVSFAEHIDDIVQSSMIKAGMLLRTFETREAQPMMKMFNSYIQSKLEYCSLIWNPHKKEDIDKIERIQKHFTSKI